MNIQIFKNLDELSINVAESFYILSENYINQKNIFTVVVSGGFTPVRLYEILGSERYRNKIKWKYVHFFWADERFVPDNHKDSNYRLLKNTLFSKILIPRENIHRIKYKSYTLNKSAEKYEKEIKKFFQLTPGTFPVFDLILLGIGKDGHTASLFPGNNVLLEKKHLVAAVTNNTHIHPRITLTLPVINNAENIIFMVSGKNKASIIRRIFKEDDSSLPAAMIKPVRGHLLLFLDKESSMYLDPS